MAPRPRATDRRTAVHRDPAAPAAPAVPVARLWGRRVDHRGAPKSSGAVVKTLGDSTVFLPSDLYL